MRKKKAWKRTLDREDWVLLAAWLRERIEEMGIASQEEFARKFRVDSTMASKVLRGHVPIPRDRIMEWADWLKLDPKNRQIFLRRAWFSHAPAEALDLVHDIERDRELAKRQVRSLKSQLRGDAAAE